MNNNRPPASIWEPICDGKQGNYYCWPKIADESVKLEAMTVSEYWLANVANTVGIGRQNTLDGRGHSIPPIRPSHS